MIEAPLDPEDERRKAMINQLGPGAEPSPTSPTLKTPSPNTGIGGGGSPTSAVAPSPTSTYNRGTAPGLWQATGNNVGAQDALLKEWGVGPLSANGTGTLPSGEIMDLRRGAKAGDNTAIWMGKGEVGPNGQATMYGQQGPGASANSMSGGLGGTLDATYRAKLIELMNGTAINDQTPGIAQPYEAARVAASRGLDDERRVMAERAYAQGGGNVDNGALNQGIQQSMERNAVGLGQIKSNLYTHEIDAQRQQLNHALDLANAVGARTEAAAIQEKLAALEQQYRYAALGENGRQFDAGLGEHSREFDDSQVFNWADWQQRQNRDALLAGLNG